jgi:starch synthase
MKVLLAHPGTQHAPALARELDRRGMLYEFRTGFALRDRGWFKQLSALVPGIPGMRVLRNRLMVGIDPQVLHCDYQSEFRAHWRIRMGEDPVVALQQRNRVFQERIPDLSIHNADAIIGFDTSSWVLAQRAKNLGKLLLMERTTDHPAHWKSIEKKLHQDYPEWQGPPVPRPDALVAAENSEHALSRNILVGSSFVAETMGIMGVDASKIVVNPYGVAWESFEGDHESNLSSNFRPNRPVRFLFAGNIGARKGIPVLLEAWKRLQWKKNEAELWLVGTIQDRHRRLIPSCDSIHLRGRVAKADMAAIYRQCDCFVLPSFSEGFPLVLLESLAAGLSVITTPNTGGGDLQEHGAADCVTLVEAGSVEALMAAMRIWNDDPPRRSAVRAACDKLRDRYSWEAYGDRWAALLNGLLT